MVEIVNIVASGDLERELNLDKLLQDIDVSSKEYMPEFHPGLHLRFKDEGPLLTLYSSGSYVIMGAKTHDAVHELFNQMRKSLEQLGIDIHPEKTAPTVQNIICKGDLNREVNLSALAVGLELENIEYEPEQSPFLYYWPGKYDCVLSIPTNGQVAITGIRTVETAEEAFTHLQETIESLVGDS